MAHIFTPDDQTNQKLFSSHKQYVKCNNSIPFRLKQKENSGLIVATINPILHRPCVHPSTFHNVLIHKFCSSKRREIIIFAHNYFKKQTQTKHLIALILFEYSFPCKRIRYLKPIAINTNIDCPNNSKCSVRYILKATARSLESVLLEHFLL